MNTKAPVRRRSDVKEIESLKKQNEEHSKVAEILRAENVELCKESSVHIMQKRELEKQLSNKVQKQSAMEAVAIDRVEQIAELERQFKEVSKELGLILDEKYKATSDLKLQNEKVDRQIIVIDEKNVLLTRTYGERDGLIKNNETHRKTVIELHNIKALNESTIGSLRSKNAIANQELLHLHGLVDKKNDIIKALELKAIAQVKWGMLFRKQSWWIGAHWSPSNKRLCVNVIPFVTWWMCASDGTPPKQGKDLYRSDA